MNITAAVDLPYMRQLGTNMVEGVEQKVSMGEVVDPVLVASLKNFKDDCLERFLSKKSLRKSHPLLEPKLNHKEGSSW